MSDNKKKARRANPKNTPVVIQMEASECGAASLSMVLAHFGKWLPLSQIRKDCGVSRDGSSAKSILSAARGYGLCAKGYKCSIDGLKSIALPAIIHWNFNHFVVLCGFRRGRALINDPASGRRVVGPDEFDKAFTGIALEFSPGEDFVPEGRPRSVFGFAKSALSGTAQPVVFAGLMTLLTSSATIISTLLGKIYVDYILGGTASEWLAPFITAAFGLAAFAFVTQLVQMFYMLKLRGKIAVVTSSTFMWHLLKLPIEFFAQRYAGDIALRQESNREIVDTLVDVLAPAVLNLAVAIIYLAVMLSFSPLLTLIGLLAVALNLLITQLLARRRIEIAREQLRDEGMLRSVTMSGIEMIETIKASGAEQGYFERWAGYHAKTENQYARGAELDARFGTLPALITQLCSAAVLALGALLIMRSSLTAGALVAFQSALTAMLVPVDSLLEGGKSLQEMKSSIERVDDVLNYPADGAVSAQPGATAVPLPDEPSKLSGKVELRGVTFGYNRLAKPLIKDFSLSLEPGSKVAIVGASGCGKSTIAKLIGGLYRPWEGKVLFDGLPRDKIPAAVMSASVAVVDQNISMFEDTVGNNIKLWDKSIQDFEVIVAANDAQIHGDILSRNGGYSAVVQENGRNFSGGQRQRIEIARVLAQDPTILILDEATSALDAVTEKELTDAVCGRGITCIVIAHRLSTIRDCGEIIVMNDGEVVERGTHDELFAAGGLYTRLVSVE